MTSHPHAITLKPDFAGAGVSQSRSFWRAVTARALGQLEHADPIKVAKRTWPRDAGVEPIIRSAVDPAATVGSWGDETLHTVIGPFLTGIATRSAAAKLFAEVLQVSLAGTGTVSLPYMSTKPAPVFVAEGGPAPMALGVFDTVEIGPSSKMMFITGFTSELIRYGAESAEALIRAAVAESAAVNLDAVVFDDVAGTAARPAGLLYGVTGLSAVTGGGLDALVGDVKQLIAAIHTAGGGANVWLFAAPSQAVAAAMYVGSFGIPIISTPALATGTIIAVETGAVASAYTGAPQIDTSIQATVHYESSPTPISAAGSPPTVAAPVYNPYQSDHLLMRVTLRTAWTMRAPGMVQFVENVTW